jgi:soluble lytic murein transglycosylase-like protein
MRAMAVLSGQFARGLAVLAIGLLALPVQAEVYQYRDAYGRITLTDKPMQGGVTLEKVYSLKGHLTSPAPKGSLAQRKRSLMPIISRVAREERMQPALLHAVIHAESAYDSRAVSSKGAVGLMQLMPATARRYGVSDRRDPMQNLRGGARYLKDLLAMFKNDLTLALAAYNAGENAVIRSGNRVPPYPETQRYVRKVREIYAARLREG